MFSKSQIIAALFCIIVFGYGLSFALKALLIPELPTVGPLPQYAFTASDQSVISSSDLLGKVQLISFFFSRCKGPCPRLNADLSRIATTVSDPRLQLVSISVDPSYDTPQILANYKTRFASGASHWSFVTGDVTVIKEFSESGLKLALGADLTHSRKAVLVDPRGSIRGLFDPATESEQLIEAIRSLL